MKSRLVIGAALMLALVGGRVQAQTNDNVAGQRRWAVVNITDPVIVGRQILMGTYLVIHDDAKMAKGAPCTTIYRFDPKTGPKEQIIAFMCLPKKVTAPETNTLAVVIDPVVGKGKLQAYEFAGDSESHGVPSDAR